MSDHQKPNIRIADIARMAGVSAGTVDWVIHDRGKVSAGKLRKVREVLDKVDYRPNLLARSFASGRPVALCVLIPRFAAGEYWADANEGVARAAAGLERFNVSGTRIFFDQYDSRSFGRALDKARGERLDAVLLATLLGPRLSLMPGNWTQPELLMYLLIPIFQRAIGWPISARRPTMRACWPRGC